MGSNMKSQLKMSSYLKLDQPWL